MRKIATTVVTAVALMLVLAACGSSSSSGNADDAGATTTTASPASGAGADNDAFKQLVANREKQALKVTYKISSSITEDSTVTVAQDGKGNFSYVSGDQHTIKRAGEKPVTCTGAGSDATCQELPVDPSVGYTAIFDGAAKAVTNASGDSPFTNVSTETIADREAKCVTVSAVGTKSTICADKETGILLKYEGSAAGQTISFEATEVTEPSDSDFAIPSTPKTLPKITLPNGVTLPNS